MLLTLNLEQSYFRCIAIWLDCKQVLVGGSNDPLFTLLGIMDAEVELEMLIEEMKKK